MQALLPLLLVLVVLAICMLPALALGLWLAWRRKRDRRRSPLTDELLNLPGQQAHQKAERLMESATERFLLIVLIGPIVLSVWALQRVDRRFFHFRISEALLFGVVLIAACWAAWSASKLFRERRKYLEGLAAERATAQVLAPLTSKGCVIYHDVPTGKFNLDHVVVGPGAVFMVETKSRRKLAAGGKTSATVKFNGEALEFPNWSEAKMLEQARAQSRWLSDHLYRRAGERVPVEPVLALPGRYVTCSVPSPDVHVINPKMCNFMADGRRKPISEPQRRRIVTAIEECYTSA